MSIDLEQITHEAREQGRDPAAARTEELEIREQIRADALADANRNGRLKVSPADLARAFEGRDDERKELSRVAQAAREREAERVEQQQRHEQIADATTAVLAEWDRDRLEQARAEARRRLGKQP